MSRQQVRDYEMSIWTLQDSFITVLCDSSVAHKGQISDPIMKLSKDGTQSLDFSIPIKYRENNELIDNPLWYKIEQGHNIVNTRKIKVIFNKGKTNQGIFEFVINKITERHEDDQVIADIECEGLAFQELGKTGYKIVFNIDEFQAEYEEWIEGGRVGAEPRATIDYWAHKITDGTLWDYVVEMDWSAYDGITGTRSEGIRQVNKIYEDPYIAAWETNDNTVHPAQYETFKEKERIPEAKESNRYNLSQDLAEAFQVFCKYRYSYDENYHIIGRTIVFYNTFIDEEVNKFSVTYPYDATSIEREIDSSDIITKMFVVPIDDDTQPGGQVTIADEPANYTLEDYVINFDYLRDCGTISEEQYNELEGFKIAIARINRSYSDNYIALNEIELELPKQRAAVTNATNKKASAEERIDNARALQAAIVSPDGWLEHTTNAPELVILMKDADGSYYFNIPTSDKRLKEDTLHAYTDMECTISFSLVGTVNVRDADGNLIRVKSISLGSLEQTHLYLTYQYSPKLYYEDLINEYTNVWENADAALQEAQSRVSFLEERSTYYRDIISGLDEEKQIVVQRFERMMGPALREGNWQSDDYKDYGNNYIESIDVNTGTVTGDHVEPVFDTAYFDGEQTGYYISGASEVKHYYSMILCGNIEPQKLLTMIEHYDSLRFFYHNSNDTEQTLIINASLVPTLVQDNSGNIQLAYLFTDSSMDFDSSKDYFLGYTKGAVGSDDTVEIQKISILSKVELEGKLITNESTLTNYNVVYFRTKFKTTKVKIEADSLKVFLGNLELKKYEDYYITYRGLYPYLTLKVNSKTIQNGALTLNINFNVSNASLHMYLDALKVMKENAYPKVTYTIEVAKNNPQLLKDLYAKMGALVNIYDVDLKFENAQGYISDLELNLDKPWEDTIDIKNYKTRFEDIFERIVASTEQMKTNGSSYDRAAAAITSSGSVASSYIQSALDQMNLNYNFMNGDLTIDEINGIWGTSENGVVAYRGGGIFTANRKDNFGNWVWNTAITPNGINANLITTGQLDTNLIRIYAGNDPALQINQDGMFAYKRDSLGRPDPLVFVSHEDTGLYLTYEAGASYEGEDGSSYVLEHPVDRVAITWNGLTLNDWENNPVFFADHNGNLTLEGKIIAASGDIAGWEITPNQLSSNVTGDSEGETIAIAGAGINSNGSGTFTPIGFDDPITDNFFWAYDARTDQGTGAYTRIDKYGNLFSKNIVATQVTADEGNFGTINALNLKGVGTTALRGDMFISGNVAYETLLYKILGSGLDDWDSYDPIYNNTPTKNSYLVEYSYDRSDATEVWSIWQSGWDSDDPIWLSDPQNKVFSVGNSILNNGTTHVNHVKIRVRAFQMKTGGGYDTFESEIINVYESSSGKDGSPVFDLWVSQDYYNITSTTWPIADSGELNKTIYLQTSLNGETIIPESFYFDGVKITTRTAENDWNGTNAYSFTITDTFSGVRAESGTIEIKCVYKGTTVRKIISWRKIPNSTQSAKQIASRTVQYGISDTKTPPTTWSNTDIQGKIGQFHWTKYETTYVGETTSVITYAVQQIVGSSEYLTDGIEINLYQRKNGSSTLSVPTTEFIYYWDLKGKSVLVPDNADGWSATIPEGQNPCYIITAHIQSNGQATTIIKSSDWSEPQLLAQSVYVYVLYSNEVHPTASEVDTNPIDGDGVLYKYRGEAHSEIKYTEYTASEIFNAIGSTNWTWARYIGQDGAGGEAAVVYELQSNINVVTLNSAGQIVTEKLEWYTTQTVGNVTSGVMENLQYKLFKNGIQIGVDGQTSSSYIDGNAETGSTNPKHIIIDFQNGTLKPRFNNLEDLKIEVWYNYVLVRSLQIPSIVDSSEVISFASSLNDLNGRMSAAELKIEPGAIVSTVTSSQTYKNDLANIQVGGRNYIKSSKSLLEAIPINATVYQTGNQLHIASGVQVNQNGNSLSIS